MITRRNALQAGAALGLTIKSAHAAVQKTPDVIVIGAGLSGLRAAMDLEEQGARVQVIEGRNRIGGRVYTLKDLPGAPEAGGNGFGSGYGRCLDTASRLGLKLIDMAPRQMMNETALGLNGTVIRKGEWEKSPHNILPEKFRSMMPFAIAGGLIAKSNPLKSADDWYDPAFAKFDRPMHELYLANGFSEDQIELAYNHNAYFGTSSHDVSQLMAYFNDIWVREMINNDPVSYACAGGNSLMPEAMARQLKSPVILNKSVVGIRSEKDRADVHCADGDVLRSKFVVCTIPLPVMRFVRFDPVLPALHHKAVKTVSYIPVTQIHLLAKKDYWDEDGLPPSMWTDGIIGSLAAQRENDDNTTITSLVAFARGFGAVRLDQYTPEEAKTLVLAEIAKLRPASKGKLDAVVMKSWSRDPFSGGDWAIWAPGQVSELVPEVGKPHGRIHFAGEHTAKSNRGMEGAQESGERVAQEIGARLQ